MNLHTDHTGRYTHTDRQTDRQDRYALALRPVTLSYVNLHTDHTGRYTHTDRQTDRQTDRIATPLL